MPEHFHFLQPLWFLALIPLVLLLGWLARTRGGSSQWTLACESHLLPYLLNQPVQALRQLPLWLFAAGAVLAVVALADPVWQKQPQPVYRNQDALVVVLDLSRSMLSGDLTPSRLERARYKVADILTRRQEGQTGLVVFAGDAFTVSPLTNDARTIQSLLAPLEPDLMPVQGSRADLGLQQAGKLLQQAGIPRGDILLITDGYSDGRTPNVVADLHRQGYRLSVMGVGSNRPAPIPDGQGGFVRDSQGRVVMPALDVAPLQQLASVGGGRYQGITVDDTDLAQVLPSSSPSLDSPTQRTELATDRWRSQGPWLVLALLPLAALAFRRGWLLTLPLVMLVTLGVLPRPAMAAGWDDLWWRQDQQAHRALRAGDIPRARQLASSPLLRGEAAYRAGDYAAAMDAFSASDSAQGDYNRGDALAQLGRYQDAIASYDQALAKKPGMADALHNKQELEKWLKQKPPQADNKNNKDSQAQNSPEKNSPEKNSNDKRGDDKSGQQQADAKDGKGRPDTQPADNTNNKESKGNNTQQTDNRGAGDNHDKSSPEKNIPEKNIKEKNSNGKNDQTAAQARASSGKPPGDEASASQARQDAQAQKDKPAITPMDTAGHEQQQADERWLRRIPDDPGGLLRRKFLYQYSQRGARQDTGQQSW